MFVVVVVVFLFGLFVLTFFLMQAWTLDSHNASRLKVAARSRKRSCK